MEVIISHDNNINNTNKLPKEVAGQGLELFTQEKTMEVKKTFNCNWI
jgi:hypothetical protein